MIRNHSLTLRDIADSIAKKIAAQQTSIDSLVKVVPDNRIALDYLLGEQGDVCAVANTMCCTQIENSGEVQTQLHKIIKQAIWL